MSNWNVRIRFKLLLPIVGLMLFTTVTYQSVRFNREARRSARRYFYWSSIRLDSDPQSKHHREMIPSPCIDGTTDCLEWNRGWNYIVKHPGLWAQILGWSALPASLVTALIVLGLAKLGLSEILSFMFFAPLLITTWYYLIGSLLDHWRRKRSQNTAALAARK
jgi:hypothetical protein